MSKIVVVGGTGYAGGWVAREAVARGHSVTSFSRNAPKAGSAVDGIRYETGSMLDDEARRRAVAGADAVVSAMFPGGEMMGRTAEANVALASLASAAGARFGVVGGFSSLRRVEGGPRLVETEKLPDPWAEIARQMVIVLDRLEELPKNVDWFYAAPAFQFGSHVPGEHRGSHRIGGSVALFDKDGVSAISGADFADAILDEIERPRHHRAQFSVAY
jgi:putative NADH-flavin reductase